MKSVAGKKYNPGFLTDDELVASFCVRTYEFESIVDSIQDNTGNSNVHSIVIGPRGSGKTHLLLRVAVELRRDDELAGFFPIVFAEESYEVTTCGEFWLECLGRLAEQAPPGEGADLGRSYEDLRTGLDDRMLAERCLSGLLDFADRHGQRLVLLVENLNMLLAEMVDKDAGWRLRQIFQTEPRIILLGSATSRFAEIDHPEHALYDLFRVITLRELDTKECEVLWQTVSGKSPTAHAIRPLQILTGGNPRLLTIIARFGAGHSFRQLMANLLDLVDEHTEYFKNHLDSLPAQERRVYLALARLWKPATTREIASEARLDTNTCSAQLRRLVGRGVVANDGGTSRRREYFLTQRLYNIYYLLRRGAGASRVVEALIQFMASYYSPSDLLRIGVGIARSVDATDTHLRELQLVAFTHLIRLPEMETFLDRLLNDVDLVSQFGLTEASEVAEPMAKALLEKADALAKMDQPAEALELLDEVLRRFCGGEDLQLVNEVAQAHLEDLLQRHRGNLAREEPPVYKATGSPYSSKRTPMITAFEDASLNEKEDLFIQMKRLGEVVGFFDSVMERCVLGGSNVFLAEILVNKGLALARIGLVEHALKVFDQALRQCEIEVTPESETVMATMLVCKGLVLERVRRQEALEAYDEVICRFAGLEAQGIGQWVARALVGKGTALASEQQILSEDEAAALLAHLVEFDEFPLGSVAVLIQFSAGAGPARALELIGESQMAEQLLPLVTALEQLSDGAPAVAREVEEIARDIRSELQRLSRHYGGRGLVSKK